MGLHLNWLAVQNADRAELPEQLGFEACGWADDELNSAYACATLPPGWVIIVSNAYALDLDRLLPQGLRFRNGVVEAWRDALKQT